MDKQKSAVKLHPNSVYTHKNWFTQLHSDLGRIRY